MLTNTPVHTKSTLFTLMAPVLICYQVHHFSPIFKYVSPTSQIVWNLTPNIHLSPTYLLTQYIKVLLQNFLSESSRKQHHYPEWKSIYIKTDLF